GAGAAAAVEGVPVDGVVGSPRARGAESEELQPERNRLPIRSGARRADRRSPRTPEGFCSTAGQ
ncbi:MAG: hypothetical protein NT154_09740, partial [Verrucomicrobia bacterium]|nr:hypothetical protein [Verrucomicrobiota bacterium]